MFTVADTNEEFIALDHDCKVAAETFFSRITPTESKRLVPANATLFFELEAKNSLFVIREGNACFAREEARLFFYEEWDVIGIEDPGLTQKSEIQNDFAIIVDRYDRETLQRTIANDVISIGAWNKFLSLHIARITQALWLANRAGKTVLPTVKAFEAGTAIIKQDTEATEVFTLLEGSADVYVDKVKVGEVLTDEIFGALAGLSGTTRTADVIARTNCLVLAVLQEDFIKLIQARPELVQKLVQDMARSIRALNSQVISHTEPT